ncbi:carboxylesterase family protein [Actinacidiphila glaucinigra]|uniref:carboxylesterase family protein n=1 Tax=Actinacidiphila glaucinigra TaxID=235986 RepID=UPI0033AE1456
MESESGTEGQRRPVVATERGSVRGVTGERGVAAFRGIPYAASPVGALRFAPPAPPTGWPGVRDAAHAGPDVPQGPSRLAVVTGPHETHGDEEGCLTLNVWSPEGALEPGAAPRAVLVWFHGGGFTTGSGGWDWYDGARLAALGGIVVVTANYRLGPLGWLYLPEIGANNLGSRDQAAVLYWVRDNIASFGGDPALITVGGQSAGAYCALCLAADPGTRPLVRRVIAESGPWGLAPQEPAEAAEVATAYLRLRGVRHPSELREMPAERLVSAYGRLSAERARPGEVAPQMYPVLGGAGLPVAPLAAVAAGGLDGTDVLLGSTQDEITAFRAASPAGFPMEGATERVFGAGVTDIASRCAERGRPAYAYRFTRRPPGDDGTLGATHCSELPFLFGNFEAFAEAPMLGLVDESDRALARAFGGALASFVATGRPDGGEGGGQDEGRGPWRAYEPGAGARVRTFGSQGR